MISIIDYNMGNLQSVVNAFEKIGTKAKIISSANEILKSDRVILPGVGAFGDAMEHLQKEGLDEAIIEFTKSGKPFLGICLGMQLLFNNSNEFGKHRGLSLIDGDVVLFDKTKFKTPHKIPHMGWNRVQTKNSKLFRGMSREFYLYFVHSYHVICDEKYVLATTNYGYEFVSGVEKENIFGLQPHPEKSHNNGLKILENFMKV